MATKFKVGDRVRFKSIHPGTKSDMGTVADLGVTRGFIGVRRDDSLEGGSVPGLWLFIPDLLELIVRHPEANRFQVAFEEID